MTDLIAEYEQHLRRLGRAQPTITSYITDTLRRMDRELPAGLLAALPEELERWLYNESWSPSTRHQRRAAVVGFFAFACSPKRRTRLDWNPAADLPTVFVPTGRGRPAPPGTIVDLLARAAEPFRTWIVIGAYAGARCCEIANLNRGDITTEQLLLKGKGGRSRMVPTHELVWAAIKELPPGPVAVAADGSRLTRKDVSRLGNRHICQLGHDITMHQLRHSFGSEAFAATLDIMAVRDLLGHASVATTQTYIQTSKSAMRRAVAGLYSATARAVTR